MSPPHCADRASETSKHLPPARTVQMKKRLAEMPAQQTPGAGKGLGYLVGLFSQVLLLRAKVCNLNTNRLSNLLVAPGHLFIFSSIILSLPPTTEACQMQFPSF